jgi:hypothetical protein
VDVVVSVTLSRIIVPSVELGISLNESVSVNDAV